GGARIPFVEQGAADQIIGIAGAPVLRIGSCEGFELGNRLVVLTCLPEAEALTIGVLAFVNCRYGSLRDGSGPALTRHLIICGLLRRNSLGASLGLGRGCRCGRSLGRLDRSRRGGLVHLLLKC